MPIWVLAEIISFGVVEGGREEGWSAISKKLVNPIEGILVIMTVSVDDKVSSSLNDCDLHGYSLVSLQVFVLVYM